MQHKTSVMATRTWLTLVVLISKSVLVVYFVIWFKNGSGKELGDCKCVAQTPESGDVSDGA